MKRSDPKLIPTMILNYPENEDFNNLRGVKVFEDLEQAGLLVIRDREGTKKGSPNFPSPLIFVIQAFMLTEEYVDNLEQKGKSRPHIFIIDYTTDAGAISHATFTLDGNVVDAPEYASDGSLDRAFRRALPLADAVMCSYASAVPHLKRINKNTFHVPDVTDDPKSYATFVHSVTKAFDAARKKHHKTFRKPNGTKFAFTARVLAPFVRSLQRDMWTSFAADKR